MNFLKRAMTSIKRRPGKSVILLLLVFILGNIISGAISIQQAVGNTEANLRRSLPAVATVYKDWDAQYRHQETTGENVNEQITPEIIRQLGELDYVKEFDYSAQYYDAYSSDLERYVHPNPEYEWVDNHLDEVEGLNQFILRGVHNPEILDINAGIIELVQGRVFTEQDMQSFNGINSVAIISQEFADLNNLTIDSTFTLDNTMYDWDYSGSNWLDVYNEDNVLDRESYEFTVVGIYEPIVTYDSNDEYDDARREVMLQNRIYVPNIVSEHMYGFMIEARREHYPDDMEEMYEEGQEPTIQYEDIVYLLNDPTELTDFAEAGQDMLPQFWEISDLSNTFGDISSSMETLQWLASLVLWIAVLASILILSLLVTLFLRDRKHEIGIYLALGEKKIKVITQIILEVMVTGVVAITLALFTGNLIAGNISENMLRRDLIAGQEDDFYGHSYSYSDETLGWFSPGEMSMEDMLASYDLSLEATTVLWLYSVGIGTILISSAAPILYIMRLNPKKIMM